MATKNHGNDICQLLKTNFDAIMVFISHHKSVRIHEHFIGVIIQAVTLPNFQKFKMAAENQENHTFKLLGAKSACYAGVL